MESEESTRRFMTGRQTPTSEEYDKNWTLTVLQPFTTGNYFEQYVHEKPTVFAVKGQEIIIASEKLANAFSLSEQGRTVLLLYFFLGYSERRIGNEYGRSRSTVNYLKLAALK